VVSATFRTRGNRATGVRTSRSTLHGVLRSYVVYYVALRSYMHVRTYMYVVVSSE